jgi:tetratricopeptide (TPR) repeat protein
MGFLKSLLSGKAADSEADKQRKADKEFEVYKYDGMRAQRMGHLDFAEQCFRKALALHEDFETMSYLAQVEIQRQHLDEARTLLTQMDAMEPSHLFTLLTLAHVCDLQADADSLAEVAEKAIAADADSAQAYFFLAKAMLGKGDLLMTIAHLTRAITLHEDYKEAYLLRAETLLKMQQYTEAAKDLTTVLSKDAGEEAAILLYGRLHEAEGRLPEAEEHYRQVNDINPFNEQAYLLLGHLYMGQKRYQEAITLFDEAIDINPSFAQAYHERGNAKLLNGDKEGAVEDLKQALELNPSEGEKVTGQYQTGTPSGGQTLPGIF